MVFCYNKFKIILLAVMVVAAFSASKCTLDRASIRDSVAREAVNEPALCLVISEFGGFAISEIG